MDDTISINITVADRIYPIRVKESEQSIVKEAEHLLNDKFYEFQLKYTGQEKLDYLAMSALMNVVELMKNNQQDSSIARELNERLSEAELLIAEALRK